MMKHKMRDLKREFINEKGVQQFNPSILNKMINRTYFRLFWCETQLIEQITHEIFLAIRKIIMTNMRHTFDWNNYAINLLHQPPSTAFSSE